MRIVNAPTQRTPMRKPPLGELEREVLAFLTEQAPVTVREVAEQLGEPRGLARTTILTVMENLRKKGYLTRSKGDKAFRYALAFPKTELLRNLVKGFVDNTLGGSVSPIVAYLADAERITEQDLAELERLVEELRSARETEQ
jgi:predicted transcriptional regulator